MTEEDPRWQGTLRYTPGGADGHPRPHLWLRVTGPDGAPTLPINGLVDTGADTSLLPFDYINLLEYQDDDLELVEVDQVEGSVKAWAAKRPCQAVVVGGPDETFDLLPLFVAGALQVLWGRKDFMSVYAVSVYDATETLMLTLP